jgi:23S rRNA (adenine2503-C2)-methyltransferase
MLLKLLCFSFLVAANAFNRLYSSSSSSSSSSRLELGSFSRNFLKIERNDEYNHLRQTVLYSTSYPGKDSMHHPTESAKLEELPIKNHGTISMSLEELAIHLNGWGRARIAWDCYLLGIDPYHYFSGSEIGEPMEAIQSLLPTSRKTQRLGSATLEALCQLNGGLSVDGGIATLIQQLRSKDDTTKLLLKLQDGMQVETVLIPWNNIRTTVCISSQVGCRQGCTFCATGRMGRLRNLSSDEILVQLFFAIQVCRRTGLPPITNVVFMGMGEPSDNIDAVRTAIFQMTTRELFQLSSQRVTVSTVAPTPHVFDLLCRDDARCVIAWSVHAVRDDLRRKLVPTTQYTMVELRQGLIDALLRWKPRGKRICMLEVALMDQVNDSLQEADDMVEFVHGILYQIPDAKVIVNLIPFNEIGQIGNVYRKPTIERVLAFQNRLQSEGVYCHIRTTRGDDESAACGQLATKRVATRKISISESITN